MTGAVDALPLVVGAIPFGVIVGVTSTKLGLSAFESTAMSAVIFAGAAQLATYDLIAQNTPWLVVVLTGVLINLRFLLYSAAIAPTFSGQSRPRRLLYSYLLTDQAYALTSARALRDPEAEHPAAYFFGCALAMWTMWMVATFVGATAGAAIPAGWSLDFAVPLCFIAILIPAIKDRAQVICAVATGAIALATRGAPHGSGTIIAIIGGIAVGALAASTLFGKGRA